MTTATTDSATLDADSYLREVAPHLAAMPADERAELLDDLAQHLREIAAEPGPPLAERLGPPQEYAAELLASAGVEPVPPGRRRWTARAGALVERARATALGREIVRLAPVLRPAWWVARAYLAVSLLAALGQDGGYPGFPLPRLADNEFVGLLAVLAAVPVSVRLAHATPNRAGRVALAGGTAVLLVYGVALLDRVGRTEVRYVGDYQPTPWTVQRGCLLNASGEPITNLYAYDTDGRLLDPVLLYDQDGRPIDNLCVEYDSRGRRLATEYRQDVNGAPVINAFPRRQSAFLSPEPPLGRPGMSNAPDPTTPVKPPAVVVPRVAASTTTTSTPG